MGLTDEMADMATSLPCRHIPKEAIDMAKTCVLDGIGVALAGCQEPASRIIARYVGETACAGEASIIGHDIRTATAQAAMANGTICHALDYDDTTWAYIGHPTAVILPAALALGEKASSSGKELLCSMVVGFEVACRIGSLVTPGLSERGWHSTGTIGVFGATAAASRLANLDRRQAAFAMGIAASESSGIKANFGSMVKPFHAGKAAHDSIVAVALAKRGFTSTASALERRFGFLEVFSGSGNTNMAVLRPKNTYAIVDPGVAFKPYPSCTGTHPAIDATLFLRNTHDIPAGDIESISCGTTPEATGELLFSVPQTGLEGKFSLHFCLAVALSEGSVVLEHFDDRYIGKPIIRELMRRCRNYVDPDLTKSPGVFSPASVVKIKMKDGITYCKRVDLAKGNPGNTLTQRELERKFMDCSTRRLPSEQAKRLLDTIMNLEELEDVAELMRLTR